MDDGARVAATGVIPVRASRMVARDATLEIAASRFLFPASERPTRSSSDSPVRARCTKADEADRARGRAPSRPSDLTFRFAPLRLRRRIATFDARQSAAGSNGERSSGQAWRDTLVSMRARFSGPWNACARQRMPPAQRRNAFGGEKGGGCALRPQKRISRYCRRRLKALSPWAQRRSTRSIRSDGKGAHPPSALGAGDCGGESGGPDPNGSVDWLRPCPDRAGCVRGAAHVPAERRSSRDGTWHFTRNGVASLRAQREFARYIHQLRRAPLASCSPCNQPWLAEGDGPRSAEDERQQDAGTGNAN
jgi:hypothetical protein